MPAHEAAHLLRSPSNREDHRAVFWSSGFWDNGAKHHQNKMAKCSPCSTGTDNTIQGKCTSLIKLEKRSQPHWLFCCMAHAFIPGIQSQLKFWNQIMQAMLLFIRNGGFIMLSRFQIFNMPFRMWCGLENYKDMNYREVGNCFDHTFCRS